MVVLFHKNWADKHIASLDLRLRAKKGHSKAVAAVARQLVEAVYWILKKGEPFRERDDKKIVSSNLREVRLFA